MEKIINSVQENGDTVYFVNVDHQNSDGTWGMTSEIVEKPSDVVFHTKAEILEHIDQLEKLINRYNMDQRTVDRANMCEWRRDELQEIVDTMTDDQLADCDHLFWF